MAKQAVGGSSAEQSVWMTWAEHRAYCVGSKNSTLGVSHRVMHGLKQNTSSRNMATLWTYTQFRLVNNTLANEVFRELHTVSEESPCCHSVVFEALEKGTVSIFVFTKFPCSCAFFATSTSKTILCSVPDYQLRSATIYIPFPKWNRTLEEKRHL